MWKISLNGDVCQEYQRDMVIGLNPVQVRQNIWSRVKVTPANFSNDILGRTKCTLLTPNCLVGFNPSIKKDCPGRQLSRDRGINKKQVQSLYRPKAFFFYKFTLISLNFPICSDIIHYVWHIFFSVLINFTLAII